MPKVREKRTSQSKVTPQVLSLDQFTARLADKNKELLSAFLLGLQNGELALELDGAEGFMHDVIDEWSETAEPNRELHLRMISAVFVWMILDEVEAEDVGGSPANTNVKDVNDVLKLSVEVIQTVRQIWGIVHGKKSAQG